MLVGGFNGLLEAPRICARQQGRLDHDHFLQLHALAQHLRVVDHEPGEILVHQPDANEGMAFGQREDRVQARLFEAGRVKQRERQVPTLRDNMSPGPRTICPERSKLLGGRT